MRVSDAERDAAAAELQEHFASGRLTQDELDGRLAAAFAAKTRGDLEALFADLPSSQREWAGAGPAGAGFGAGFQNAGFQNAGFQNAGFQNAGFQNAGFQNTGFQNTVRGGVGRVLATTALLWLLLIFGMLGVFGIGTGRPFGIVLLVAAFALLRRLLFMIFGRGRRGGGRGGRGPHRRSRRR
jgi:PPE-repeat protein